MAVTTPVYTGNVFTGVSRLQTDIGDYDVTFVRGTCAQVYGSGPCALNGTPFMFTQAQTLTVVTALNTYLLGQDKAKLPGSNGDNSTTVVYTPYAVAERIFFVVGRPRKAADSALAYATSGLNANPAGVSSFTTPIPALDLPMTRLFATYTPSAVLPAVPEPGTWLMLGLGFGIVGAVARGRNSRGTVASRI